MVYGSGRAVDQPDVVFGPEQPSVALGTFNGATLEFFFKKSDDQVVKAVCLLRMILRVNNLKANL